MTIEHALIVCMCSTRAVNMTIFYTLYKEISIQAQAVIAGLPYVFYSQNKTQGT